MVFFETSVFTRLVMQLLPDGEYRKLQAALMLRPDLGPVIPSSGGLRKARWKLPGRGKRGGVRVIYYWFVSDDQVYMLMIYPKADQDDLTREQLRVLRRVVQEELRNG